MTIHRPRSKATWLFITWGAPRTFYSIDLGMSVRWQENAFWSMIGSNRGNSSSIPPYLALQAIIQETIVLLHTKPCIWTSRTNNLPELPRNRHMRITVWTILIFAKLRFFLAKPVCHKKAPLNNCAFLVLAGHDALPFTSAILSH